MNSRRLTAQARAHAAAIFLLPLLGTVAALSSIPFLGFGRTELLLLLTLSTLTLLGLSVGFHRHFAHRAFDTTTPVRVVLATLGSMACQGPLVYWVANHRRHHKYSDRPGDPHSPNSTAGRRGTTLALLWHAHVGWTLQGELTNSWLFARDLIADPVISRVNRHYYFCALSGLALPMAVGGLVSRTQAGVLRGLLWGGFVRAFVVYHVTMSINSLTHRFGARALDTRDESRNAAWLAPFTFGESWHNNHHAEPSAASFATHWWQIDIGGSLIMLLERLRLVWRVNHRTHLPTGAEGGM